MASNQGSSSSSKGHRSSSVSTSHHHHESTSHVNDFWRIKIKYYFNEILDCNDDGKLSAEDIKIIIEFYKEIKKLNEKSSKFVNFSNFLEKWKSNLLAGKESINSEEFQKYSEGLRVQLLRTKDWPSDMRNYIDALFTVIDDDNDGYINLKDFLSIAINEDDKQCRQQSWKLISGSSSTETFKLSKESFDKLCREFITSTDSKALGNWIFGTFDYKNYEKNKELEREAKEKFFKEKDRIMDKVQKEKDRQSDKDSKDTKKSSDENKSGNEKLNDIEKNALR